MNRILNIKSIHIWLDEFVDMEITRGNEVEVISFGCEDKDKLEALYEFVRVFKLQNKIKIIGG